jgi:hypothetical protein
MRPVSLSLDRKAGLPAGWSWRPLASQHQADQQKSEVRRQKSRRPNLAVPVLEMARESRYSLGKGSEASGETVVRERVVAGKKCCVLVKSGHWGYRSPYLPHAKRALYHLS